MPSLLLGEYNLSSVNIIVNILEHINLYLEDGMSEKDAIKKVAVERDIPNADELEFIDIGENRLNKIFEKQCELNGDKIILTASDGEFTYNDLNKKANRLANALITKGI